MMMRVLVGGLVALLLIALGFVSWGYVASEAHLRSFERPPAFAYAIPTDAASIIRGDHIVRTRGCRGCHGDDLAGGLMGGYVVAPNLAEYARNESAATFEAAMRRGIGRDGRALYFMPSYNFLRMRDKDVADVIAYLRTVPVGRRELPRASLPWPVRLDIALGKDAAIPAYLDRVPPLRRAGDDPSIARGEYIAMTTCNECHGFGLRADSPWESDTAPPDLIVIRAYDEAAFRRLMREGIAIGDRELEMMSPVARNRYSHFTDQEVGDLHSFLTDMSARVGERVDEQHR